MCVSGQAAVCVHGNIPAEKRVKSSITSLLCRKWRAALEQISASTDGAQIQIQHAAGVAGSPSKLQYNSNRGAILVQVVDGNTRHMYVLLYMLV